MDSTPIAMLLLVRYWAAALALAFLVVNIRYLSLHLNLRVAGALAAVFGVAVSSLPWLQQTMKAAGRVLGLL
jgi:hypothetical protein